MGANTQKISQRQQQQQRLLGTETKRKLQQSGWELLLPPSLIILLRLRGAGSMAGFSYRAGLFLRINDLRGADFCQGLVRICGPAGNFPLSHAARFFFPWSPRTQGFQFPHMFCAGFRYCCFWMRTGPWMVMEDESHHPVHLKQR